MSKSDGMVMVQTWDGDLTYAKLNGLLCVGRNLPSFITPDPVNLAPRDRE